ncbi:hypothetical protein ACTTAI_17120 [Rhodobacter capsulatus]|uniref:hypothetical protein n=1 Tax=Rhodobacter capsulatus TaxID=1061 RepID=UPI004025CAA2
MTEAKGLKSCFFVTPIGANVSPERKRADDLLHLLLRPIATNLLNIVRADEVDAPGAITTDIVQRLYNCELVIADLTGQNPNVMYEVGLRHCFNRPIVHICQSGQTLPFDLAAERTIFFDLNDIRSVNDTKPRLLNAIKSALEYKNYRSPVAQALELESLFASSQELPLPRTLLEKLNDLEEKLDDVSSDLSLMSFQGDGVSPSDADAGYLDRFASERLMELLRIFDRVGPGDLERLVKSLK